MRAIPTFLGMVAIVYVGSALAKEPYDGIWGDANVSCQAEDSRLGIRGNRFDWYETHCTGRRLSGTGSTWKFDMSCRGEGQKFRRVTTISLPSPDRLVMDNAPVGPDNRRQIYKRCPQSGR